MTSVCRQPTSTSRWWVRRLYPDPGIWLLFLIWADMWIDIAMSNETFCDFFSDHARWTTLRRLISARILYQHLTGLGVLSPKLNCKFFVKIYITTYPARFHSSHAVMKPKTKMIKVMLQKDDSQRPFLAQHRVKMLEQCCSLSKRCRNNVVTLCCAIKS